MSETAKTGPERIVGKYFHATVRCSLGHRRRVWTGRILACVTPELFLVDYRVYPLECAEPGQELMTVDQFRDLNPLLYDDIADLKAALEPCGDLSHDCDDPNYPHHEPGRLEFVP